jgi:hypothetical protein
MVSDRAAVSPSALRSSRWPISPSGARSPFESVRRPFNWPLGILRHAKRMLIENALADPVRFFHIDALSSSVGFKVDFDMALLVLASCLDRMMARRMLGCDDAQARQIFRDLIDMPADVAITDHEVKVRFHRRAHLPIVLASGLIDKPVPVPWWDGLPLRLAE